MLCMLLSRELCKFTIRTTAIPINVSNALARCHSLRPSVPDIYRQPMGTLCSAS